MKNFFKRIWYSLLLFSPLSAFASSDTGDGSLGNFLHAFTPSTYSANDLSMTYLGQIFGSVGGVVSGNNGQLLGRLFEVFNNGLLVIAGLFLTYTIFKAVVDTAHEGALMGRNPKGGSAGWIAFRTALGIGCLIPSKASGYCLIQVFFMWVVTQGVGLADMVWGRAIDYLAQEGGAVYVTSPISYQDQTALANTPAGQVLQSTICMHRLENTLNANNQANAEASGGTATPDSSTVGYGWQTDPSDPSGKTLLLTFGKNQGKYNSDGQPIWGNECGEFKVTADEGSSSSSSSSSTSGSSPTNYKQLALTQVVLDLDQPGKQIASLSSTDQLSSMTISSVNAMTTAANDYTNIVMPAMNQKSKGGEEKAKAQLEEARDLGWIVAGSYYRQLGQVNQEIQDDLNDYIPTSTNSDGSTFPAVVNGGDLQNDDFVKTAMQQVYTNTEYNNQSSYINQTVAALNEMSKKSTDGIKPISPAKLNTLYAVAAGGSGILLSNPYTMPIGILYSIISSGIVTIAIEWQHCVNNGTDDPILMLQKFGNTIIITVTLMWLIGTAAIIIAAGSVSVMNSLTGVGEAVTSGLLMFVPITLTVLLALLTTGLIFSVYVPLIPFLVYLFATLGWFVLVLEAMVAAPLVAIGITHPEGHDILGKAEQAIMMLLGVFLRPAMLLLGFLAGMILARVSIHLLNIGFRTVTDASYGNLNIFATIGLLIAYTLIVMYLVQLVFELCITKIPAFASEWMSIRSRADESRGLEAAKGGIEGMGGATSKYGDSLSQQTGHTGGQVASKHDEKEDHSLAGRGGQGGGSGNKVSTSSTP